MTKNEQEIPFTQFNDRYSPFSFAIHEKNLMRFSRKISSRLSQLSSHFHLVPPCTFALECQSRSCLVPTHYLPQKWTLWKFCNPGSQLNSERFFWPFSLMPLLSLQNIEILSLPFYFVVRGQNYKTFYGRELWLFIIS